MATGRYGPASGSPSAHRNAGRELMPPAVPATYLAAGRRRMGRYGSRCDPGAALPLWERSGSDPETPDRVHPLELRLRGGEPRRLETGDVAYPSSIVGSPRGGQLGNLPECASAPLWPVLPLVPLPREVPVSRPGGTGRPPCDSQRLSGSSPFFSPFPCCTSSRWCPDGCSLRSARSPYRTRRSCSIQ